MKVKINLPKGMSTDRADEFLEKAIKTKARKKCPNTEEFCDPVLNEFRKTIEEKHKKLVESIVEDVKVEIQRLVNSR